MLSIRHSREGRNPAVFELDSRLRGSDIHFVTYLANMTPVHPRNLCCSMAAHDEKGHLLTPGGRLMTEKDKSWRYPIEMVEKKIVRF